MRTGSVHPGPFWVVLEAEILMLCQKHEQHRVAKQQTTCMQAHLQNQRAKLILREKTSTLGDGSPFCLFLCVALNTYMNCTSQIFNANPSKPSA